MLLLLQRFRFVWLNVLFIVYLWLGQPLVLQRMLAASEAEQPDWLMGGLLLGIQALEVAGLLLKRPTSLFFARQNPAPVQQGRNMDNIKVVLLVFTPILHIAFTAMLTMVVFEMLKMYERTGATAAWQCASLVLFFAVIFKEAVFAGLVLALGFGEAAPPPVRQPQAPWIARLEGWLSPAAPTQLTWKELAQDLLGDLLLLVFSALAYTAGWDFITASSPVRGQGGELLAAYLGVSFFFFMAYFTTRSVYLMQELSMQQSRAARIFSLLSFVVVWLSALWSVPRR